MQALKAQLTDEERERARHAVARIERIGAHREKRLTEDFFRWLGTP